ERDSSYAVEQVFNVIDARARSSLPLIVTTNMTLDELKNPPSMQYARIYDRVLELCPITLKMTGESRRAGNAEARRSKAREILGE
ncbi:MAG: ATP-binding protein, partial [Faecousia sp.]